jgi:hypothetical protein
MDFETRIIPAAVLAENRVLGFEVHGTHYRADVEGDAESIRINLSD